MDKKFVVDTHAILWFIAKDNRLSSNARWILAQAERGKIEVYISTIVLAELLYICERAKSPVPFEEVLRNILGSKGFIIVPFDLTVFEKMMALPKQLDIHDRVIVATAEVYAAKVITRNSVLKHISGIETLW